VIETTGYVHLVTALVPKVSDRPSR
jgi:hypothetical protein